MGGTDGSHTERMRLDGDSTMFAADGQHSERSSANGINSAREANGADSLHYYKSGHLSRFQRAICPGFGTGTRPPGQKRWRLLSRVVEPGQNVPRAKKYLRPAGLEPKTYCLAHGLLANSPK